MKKILSTLIVIGCLIGGYLIFHSCDNQIAREYGGTVTVKVDPGYKDSSKIKLHNLGFRIFRK